MPILYLGRVKSEKNEENNKGKETSQEIEQKCERFVFFTDLESCYDGSPEEIHYYRACKEFYQNINRVNNPALPRRVTARPWASLKSVVYVRNERLARQFEA